MAFHLYGALGVIGMGAGVSIGPARAVEKKDVCEREPESDSPELERMSLRWLQVAEMFWPKPPLPRTTSIFLVCGPLKPTYEPIEVDEREAFMFLPLVAVERVLE